MKTVYHRFFPFLTLLVCVPVCLILVKKKRSLIKLLERARVAKSLIRKHRSLKMMLSVPPFFEVNENICQIFFFFFIGGSIDRDNALTA